VKQLLLLRHAKSSWDDPELADEDRPLASRGRKATKALARWFAGNELRPDAVLCSPARRTRETYERLQRSLAEPPLTLEPRLYHAGLETLLQVVQGLPDDVERPLVVGHNPGLALLCLSLSRPSPERSRVEENLPTGALCILDLDASTWRDAAPGTAELVELVLPRELG
jgi:phosphohistidine phosphatase